jgi:hypothetical protein
MSIWATVRGVTRTTAFYAGRRMFEHERPILICMACTTLSLLETTKLHTFIRLVRVMAGHAANSAFRQPVAFIEVELCKRVLMALVANCRGCIYITKIARQRRQRLLVVNAVAVCAIEPCTPMRVC